MQGVVVIVIGQPCDVGSAAVGRERGRNGQGLELCGKWSTSGCSACPRGGGEALKHVEEALKRFRHELARQTLIPLSRKRMC